MINDPISDMLTRIRNANLRNHKNTSFNYSIINENIIKVMIDEGFIEDYHIIEKKPVNELKVSLKYQEDGQPVIRSIKRVSKPGRRVHKGYQDIHPVLNSQGIKVISTSNGIKSDNQCREAKIGGEVICEIF